MYVFEYIRSEHCKHALIPFVTNTISSLPFWEMGQKHFYNIFISTTKNICLKYLHDITIKCVPHQFLNFYIGKKMYPYCKRLFHDLTNKHIYTYCTVSFMITQHYYFIFSYNIRIVFFICVKP